jgi:hypothetical protein
MEISKAEFARANRRAAELRAKVPHAVTAEYDASRERIVVALSSGFEVAFPPRALQGLEHATPEELAVIEIDPSGLMRTIICLGCLKASLVRGPGWQRSLAPKAAKQRAQRKPQPHGKMASMVVGRRR